MKKLVCIAMTIAVLLTLSVSAVAEDVSTCADEVFWDACINLMSSGQIYYTASTADTCNEISVSNCYLQQSVNGAWKTVATLPNPGAIANTYSYLTTTNGAGYITSGTYRVVATFTADGHSITRTSNERTFK